MGVGVRCSWVPVVGTLLRVPAAWEQARFLCQGTRSSGGATAGGGGPQAAPLPGAGERRALPIREPRPHRRPRNLGGILPPPRAKRCRSRACAVGPWTRAGRSVGRRRRRPQLFVPRARLVGFTEPHAARVG